MNKHLEKLGVEELSLVKSSIYLGQYIACDPRGRAIMIGAIEKQKFVYVIERH